MSTKAEQALMEAKPRQRMSDREKKLKKKLIALLRDDGRGHHHAKYAERLELFDIQIVPLELDPTYTASISFNEGIIRIGEGFLTDPATFYQLNVLMRHELAHNLLMHQIRMTYKLGEEAFAHISFSKSLWALTNVITDDEISNRKYSVEDKSIVRNMILNGREIHGLVTEDHRESWINLSVEEMYDKVCEEIETIQAKLRSGKSFADLYDEIEDGDEVSLRILDTYKYQDTIGDSIIPGNLTKFIENGCVLDSKTRLYGSLKETAEGVFEELKDSDISGEELNNLLNTIAQTSPIEVLDLFDNKKVMLYTPEEKYVAIEVLKKFKSEFDTWRDKVLSTLGELDVDDLNELLDLLK